MNLFSKRPLCKFTAAYLAALIISVILFDCRLGAILLLLSLGIIGAASALIIKNTKNPELQILPYFMGVMLACIMALLFFTLPYKQAQALHGERCDIECKISEISYKSELNANFFIKITKCNGKDCNIKAKATVWDGGDFSRGDVLQAKASFELPSSMIGGFDEKTYLLSNETFLSCELENVSVISSGKSTSPISALADSIERRLAANLSDNSYALVSALLLGRTSSLDQQISGNFRRLGISHLLAISGMHFTLLIGALSLIIDMFSISFRKRKLIIIIFAVFYMALVGFPMSVCRAGIMVIASALGALLFAKREGVTSLFAAMLLLCLISPYAIFDIGLWLSFAATLCLILISQYQNKKNEARYYLYGGMRVVGYERNEDKKSKIIYYFAVPILAAMSTLPLSAMFFGECSVLGAPATLLLSLPFDIMLLLSLLIGIGITPLAGICDAICQFVISVTGYFAKFDGVTVSLLTPHAIIATAVLFTAAGVIIIAKLQRRTVIKTLVYAVLLFCIIITAGDIASKLSNKDRTHIYFANFQTNDALVLRTANTTLLIDMSNGSSACFDLLAYELSRNGISKFDGVIITDAKARHTQTLAKLMSNYSIGSIYLLPPSNIDGENAQYHIKAAAEKHGVECTTLAKSDRISVDDCEVSVINRSYILGSELPVTYFEIATPKGSVAYIGASFEQTNIPTPQCDVLIFGAHGPKPKQSFKASSNAWVAKPISSYATGDFSVFDGYIRLTLK